MEQIGITYILAGLIVKCFIDGKTKIGRTELGGMLENFFPKNGWGHNLTKWLEQACNHVPGAKILKENNRVFVVKA